MTDFGEIAMKLHNSYQVESKGGMVGRNGYWPIKGVLITRSTGIDAYGDNDQWIRVEGLGRRGKPINGGVRFSRDAMNKIVAWWLGCHGGSEVTTYIATYLNEEFERNGPDVRDSLQRYDIPKLEDLILRAVDAYEGGAR